MKRQEDDRNPSESALLERARAGDAAAFGALFAHSAPATLFFVRARLGKKLRTKVESIDVLQDAYLDAWRAFDGFDGRDAAAFAKWVARIVENRIRGLADHFGARKRAIPEGMAHVSTIVDLEAEKGKGPATEAAARDERDRVLLALADLDPLEREAILLRYYQNRSVEEIAGLLGQSETSTRRLIGKATARLGRILEEAKR